MTICETLVDSYAVLKNLQTFFAALVAFAAALVAFTGVLLNARLSYKAAQDAANVKIEFDKNQATVASNKKQAAIVTWLLSRTCDARRIMEGNALTVIKFEQAYNMFKADEDLLRSTIQSYSFAINAMSDVFERSELSKVTLEFITEMDEIDMENYFAVTGWIQSYDKEMRDLRNGLAQFNAAAEKGEKIGKSDLETMLQSKKKNIVDDCHFVRGLEETIATRYREIRKRFHPELPAAPPENNADKPPKPATA